MSRQRGVPSAFLRAFLRYCLDGLTQYGLMMAGLGYVRMLSQLQEPEEVVKSGAVDEETVQPEGPPPGHPERLDPQHVPSAEEWLIWAQLS